MHLKKKILITGAAGFTARFLAELLSENSSAKLYFLDCRKLSLPNSYVCDLANASSVKKILRKIRPEKIYHLAGSFTNDFETDFRANVLAAENIFDALISNNIKSRTLLIGSAAEYGKVNKKDNPIQERYPLKPATIQGLTKSYQTYLMNYYHRVFGLDIVMARTFNLLGSGISRLLFPGKLQKQIEDYKKKKIIRITVGNLNASRDYIEIKNAVRHYKTIMEHGKAGEIYNVGNGKPTKIYNLLRKFLNEAGLNMNIVDVKKDHKKTDVAEIYADISKLKLLYKTIK